MVELGRREVDVDPQGRASVLALPDAGLADGLLQHPAPERHDQPGPFGERDETVRAEDPVLRVRPAHQRLGPVDAAVAHVDQRLVLDEELAAFQRRGQGVGQAVAGDRAGVGLGVGEFEAVAAGRLGPVHRDVGAAQHLRRRAFLGPALDDADAAPDRQLPALQSDRRGQGGQYADREVGHLLLGVGAGGQGDELVTAEPGDHLAGAGRAALQPVGDLDQQPVPRRVPEAVVDRLETVEVEVAQAVAVASGPAEGLLQPLEEQRPVGQAGQGVVGGLVAQAQVQQSTFGGVLHQRQLVLRLPVGVAQQRHRQIGPEHGAVVPVVRLLDAVALALATHQLAVHPPDVRGVVGVSPLADVAAADVSLQAAEHLQQGVVDLQDVPVEVGDADPHGRALEDRPEALLARVQGLLRVGARGQRRARDGLLLPEGALAQRAGVSRRDGVLEPGAAGAVLLGALHAGAFGSVRTAVEHQVRLDHAEGAGQGLGVGAVHGDEFRPHLLGDRGVEGPCVQGLGERPGEGYEVPFELGAGQRGRRDREDRPAPDRGEAGDPVLDAAVRGRPGPGGRCRGRCHGDFRRPRRLCRKSHALRPTPPKPEKA